VENKNAFAKGIGSPPEVKAGVQKLIDEVGESAASKRLGLAPSTVARLAAGMRCHRSTVAIAALRIGLR